MRQPDVHLISTVNINGQEFIVDCGYAVPFFEPMRRDLNEDLIVSLGNETYLLKPKNENEASRI
jgi:arylamine N-acetyltransferase